ncbi:MAG: cation diffusion facilitator family transporter [Myxococcota bacterium]|nr:cation diffusion facilitator family transporter [Myxococcota bacterium]
MRRVLATEAAANAAVAVAKGVAGLATGSAVILADAVHSVADLSNNAVALVAVRLAEAPPDSEHPYGHRKFETLAVFGLATLLAVLALQLVLRTLTGEPRPVEAQGWAFVLMAAVLGVNVTVSLWEHAWASRLDSDILRADARHTLADVMITLAVIASWWLAARGLWWLDPVAALLVAGLILYLAWDLFQRAVPVLVDRSPLDPETLRAAVHEVAGVRGAGRVRSRGTGRDTRVDVVVRVDGSLPTQESHEIADQVERLLSERFAVEEVTVHVEPDTGPKGGES